MGCWGPPPRWQPWPAAGPRRADAGSDTVALGQIVWGIAYRWISLTNGDNGISITGRPSVFGLSLLAPKSFYWATFLVFLFALMSMAVFVGQTVRSPRADCQRC